MMFTARVAGTSALFLAAGTTLAQQDQAAPAKPAFDPKTQVLSIEKLDIDRILVDPKDAALKAALKGLPQRLSLVPDEVRAMGEQWDAPPGLIELVVKLIAAPTRVAVTYNPQNPAGGFFGAGVLLSFSEANEAAAKESRGFVNGLVAQAPDFPPVKPSKSFTDMSELATPIGTVRFGPRQGDGGWASELHLGTVAEPDSMLKQVEQVKIDGVTPFMRVRFDTAPLTPLLGFVQMVAGADPAAATAIAELQEAGFIGPEAAKLHMMLGHSADRTVYASHYVGLGKRAEKAGMTQATLSDADLAAVPADANWAHIGKANLKYYQKQIENVLTASPEAQQVMEQFKGQTGVDLIGDVFSSLGDQYAFYLSDATGGGTLGSAVVLIGLGDSAKFRAANRKLVDFANGMLAREPVRGYAKIRSWTFEGGGSEFFTFSFPGLPVPLEATYAVTDRWLVLGGSPQAAAMAVKQIAGGGPGLFAKPAVKSLYPSGQSFVTLSYADTASLARIGYPLVSMFGSMFQNAIANKLDPDSKAPPFTVPPYAALVEGVKPEVGYSYWSGDDFIHRMDSDRSLLVNLSATFGKGVVWSPVIIATAAAVGAGIEEARGFNPAMDVDAPPPPDEPMERRRGPNFRIIP